MQYVIVKVLHMADDNKQDWLIPRPPANLPNTPPPTSGSKPPPPPPPEITVRTMSSDLESLKETGGASPTPKPFTPPELKKEWAPPASPPPPLSSEASREGRTPPSALSSGQAGGPPKITPAEFGEPKKSGTAPTSGLIEEENNGRGKKIALWTGTLMIIIGAGLAGYYIIFPLLFPPQAPPPPPALTQPPTEVPIGTIPVAEPPIAITAPHQSLLKSTDSVSNAQTNADLASLSNTLQQEAQKSNPAGGLVELTLSDANGQLPSSSVLSALLPELSPEAMKNLLEDDFTLALYYDENDAWPVYILKLKAEASQVEAQTEINKLESSPNLRNFFASDPSAQAASFKTGQANGLATRYVTFSKQGAALNVAWSGDKLIISTSYNGLKKILTSL